jgi:uncharacterized protein
MNNFISRYGPWAMVTGASSGIGSEFARQLAQRGLHLALVGRRERMLEALAAELAQRYGVSARVIALDLTAPGAVARIEAATRDTPIGLLVNNAGNGLPGAFLEHTIEDETRVVQLNAIVPLQLAHLFAGEMIRRGRGGVIFVASTLGYVGMPNAANYAATKAYLIALGEGLHGELSRRGVDALVVTPGPTKTPATRELPGVDFNQLPLNWMDAESVVRAALLALGQQASIIPGEINKAVYFLVKRVLPREMASSFFGRLLERMMIQNNGH